MPASAKKVITENSKATPQSYEGASYDLLFQLIISHGLIQPTLSLICIIFFGEQSPSCIINKPEHSTLEVKQLEFQYSETTSILKIWGPVDIEIIIVNCLNPGSVMS